MRPARPGPPNAAPAACYSPHPTRAGAMEFKALSLWLAATIGAALLAAVPNADVRGSGHSSASHSASTSHSTSHASTPHVRQPRASAYVARDSRGRIKRSAEARYEFKPEHPCPSTGRSSGACPGYVIDHVTALKRGGADAPWNMQWQTIQESKAKDKIE